MKEYMYIYFNITVEITMVKLKSTIVIISFLKLKYKENVYCLLGQERKHHIMCSLLFSLLSFIYKTICVENISVDSGKYY